MPTRTAQLRAIRAAGEQPADDLSALSQPLFVANGDHDLMVASSHSADMARRRPDATLTVYPDCGHGGLCHHHERFVTEVLALLAD